MTSISYEQGLATDTGPRRESPAFQAFAAMLRHAWRFGHLTLTGPAGSIQRLEGGEPGLEARLDVADIGFVRRVLTGGDIGFADSFVAGEWDTPDLAGCLAAFAANFDALADLTKGGRVLRVFQAIAHGLNRNSRSGSKRNIHAHYDLGDDFYRLWLDEGMSYSSALAYAPGDSLEAAQRAKHAALADAMDLRPGMSMLEIGCGWGGFAEFAAAERGAKVTAVTISRAQHDFAARRVQAAGLGERVDIALKDYRDVEGRFDRVASIEMFEAVGERYWPTYFRTVRDRLADGGRAGLQIITIDERLFDDYRARPDFIQLHVFPGGMLPSERRLRQETDAAGLAWAGVRRFGQGYADTLKEWARRYRMHAADIAALGFDIRFDRLWRYYLAYCEAGFRTGRTDVLQLALSPT